MGFVMNMCAVFFYAIRVIHPIGLYTHNARGTGICIIRPIAIYNHNANCIIHTLAIYTHNAIGFVINLCCFTCSVSCFVRHPRYQVGPRYILIILRIESFGVIFFNNLSPPLHLPFLQPYICFPTLTFSHSRLLTCHVRYVTQKTRIYLGRGLIFRSPPHATLFLQSFLVSVDSPSATISSMCFSV